VIALCRRIVDSRPFNRFILALIAVASVLVGAQTYPQIGHRFAAFFAAAESAILALFALEQILRILAERGRIWVYLRDPWNAFDFAIVAVCVLSLDPELLARAGLPAVDPQIAAILRLVRVVRVLRLVKALPRLRIIVNGLLRSVTSVGYVGLLLLLHFYIFGVLAVTLFRDLDPAHFGTLHAAFLTLFGVVTLEGWVGLMEDLAKGSPWGAPAFFVSFIVVGTIVILNLLIGVIVNAMSEAAAEAEEEEAKAARAAEAAEPTPAHALAVLEQDLAALAKRVAEVKKRLEE